MANSEDRKARRVSPLPPPSPRGEEGPEKDRLDVEFHEGETGKEGEGRGTTKATLWRWKQAYREVFREDPEGETFEARLKRALEIVRNRPKVSRLEAFRLVKGVASRSGQPQSGYVHHQDPGEQPDGYVNEGMGERSGAAYDRWVQAYVEVFGEEPNTEEAGRRLEAAGLLYDPERRIGRRQALAMVREVEERLLRKGGAPVFPSGDTSPDVTGVPLGAALLRLGRLEAQVEALERMVERTHALANAANSRALNLHELVRSALKERNTHPGDQAALSELMGKVLLEVEARIEEAERLIQGALMRDRRALEDRLAALESWVRRIGKYLGQSEQEKPKRRWPFF